MVLSFFFLSFCSNMDCTMHQQWLHYAPQQLKKSSIGLWALRPAFQGPKSHTRCRSNEVPTLLPLSLYLCNRSLSIKEPVSSHLFYSVYFCNNLVTYDWIRKWFNKIGRLQLSLKVGKLDLAETDSKNLTPDCKPFDVRCLDFSGQLQDENTLVKSMI